MNNTSATGNVTAIATSSLFGAGTNGFVLGLVNGLPSWVATTTLANISGTLGIASGGTNATSFGTTNGITYYDGTRLVNDAQLTYSGTTDVLTLSYASTTVVSASGAAYFATGSGNVGVGTTTPWAKSSVSLNGSNGALNFVQAFGGETLNIVTSGSGLVSRYGANGTEAGGVGAYGNGVVAGIGLWGGTVTGGPALYVTSGSNVGIGTTSPQWKLTLADTTKPQLTLADGSSTAAPYNFRAIGNKLYISTSSPSTFATTTSSFFSFDSSTGSTTAAKLDVTGTATSTFGAGINLTTGCFAINNTCVSGGAGGGITAIGPTGQTQTGSTITLATSSTAFNGLTASTTITGSGNTITFANTLAGTLAVGGGGTGATTLTGLLVGNGTSAFTAVTTSSGIAGQISDETGSSGGVLVFSASPSLTGTLTVTNTGVTTVGGDSGRAIEMKASSAGVAQYFDWADLTAEDFDFRLINNSASNNFQIISSTTSNLFTLTGAGNVGIGSSTPWRNLSVTGTVANAQVAIAYDQTNYTQLQVGSTGDLFAYPSGSDSLFNDGNLWVCSGGSGSTNGCPSGAPSGNGSIIAETGIGVASSTPWAGISVATGKAIVVAENTLATSTSMTVDWRNGNQQLVRLGFSATTISFSGFVEGQKLVLTVCNPNGTGGALSFGTQVLWPGGTIPTQTTSANKCDVWSFLATMGTSTLKILGSQTPNF